MPPPTSTSTCWRSASSSWAVSPKGSPRSWPSAPSCRSTRSISRAAKSTCGPCPTRWRASASASAGRSTRRTSWGTPTRPTSAPRSRAAWTSGCGSSRPTPTARRPRRGVPQAGRPPGPDNPSVHVTFPALLRLGDVGLLLLRLMVAAVFLDSGRNHLRNPSERSKSIGASTGFTVFLGAAEVAGSVGVALGILTQLAAIGLILIMLGAIQKKVFVWKIGFWGGRAYGWHYDLMLLVMNLVIVTTGGGRLVLF